MLKMEEGEEKPKKSSQKVLKICSYQKFLVPKASFAIPINNLSINTELDICYM